MGFTTEKRLLEIYRQLKGQLKELQDNIPEFAPDMVVFGLAYYELAGRECLDWEIDETIKVDFLKSYFPHLQINNVSNEIVLSPPENVIDPELFVQECADFRLAHYYLCKQMGQLYSSYASHATSQKDKNDFWESAVNWHRANEKLAKESEIAEVKRLSDICKCHAQQLQELKASDFSFLQSEREENQLTISDLIKFGIEFYDIASGVLNNNISVTETSEPFTTYVKAILFKQDIGIYLKDKISYQHYERFKLIYKQLCQTVGEWQFKHAKDNINDDLRTIALSWYKIEASLNDAANSLIEEEESEHKLTSMEIQKKINKNSSREHEESTILFEKEEERKEQEEKNKALKQKELWGRLNRQLGRENETKIALIDDANELLDDFATIKFRGTQLLKNIFTAIEQQGENRALTVIHEAVNDTLIRMQTHVQLLSSETAKLEDFSVNKFKLVQNEDFLTREVRLKNHKEAVENYTKSIENFSVIIHQLKSNEIIRKFKRAINKQLNDYKLLIKPLINPEKTAVKIQPLPPEQPNVSNLGNVGSKKGENTSEHTAYGEVTEVAKVNKCPQSKLPEDLYQIFSKDEEENLTNGNTNLQKLMKEVEQEKNPSNENSDLSSLQSELNSINALNESGNPTDEIIAASPSPESKNPTISSTEQNGSNDKLSNQEKISSNPILILLHDEKQYNPESNLTEDTLRKALETITAGDSEEKFVNQLKALEEAYLALNDNILTPIQLLTNKLQDSDLFFKNLENGSVQLYLKPQISDFFKAHKHTGFNQHLSNTQLEHLKILKTAAAAIALRLITEKKKVDKFEVSLVMKYAPKLIKANTTRYNIFAKLETNLIFTQTSTEKKIRRAAAPAA